MPVRIIQSNSRVAEVQVICDSCGKLIQTKLVPKQEAETNWSTKMFCCQCKQAKASKNEP